MVSGGKQCLVRGGDVVNYTSHSPFDRSSVTIMWRGKEVVLTDIKRDGTIDMYTSPDDIVLAKPEVRACNRLFADSREKLMQRYLDIIEDTPGNNWSFNSRSFEAKNGYSYEISLERIETDGTLRMITVAAKKESNGFVQFFQIREGHSSDPRFIVNVGDDYSAFGRETADKFFEEAKRLQALKNK